MEEIGETRWLDTRKACPLECAYIRPAAHPWVCATQSVESSRVGKEMSGAGKRDSDGGVSHSWASDPNGAGRNMTGPCGTVTTARGRIPDEKDRTEPAGGNSSHLLGSERGLCGGPEAAGGSFRADGDCGVLDQD